MSSWADVSSAVAGALVFVVGALVPRFISAAERWLDRFGGPAPAPSPSPPPAQPPESPPAPQP